MYTLGFVLVILFLVILLVCVVTCYVYSEYLLENSWLFFIIGPLIFISVVGTCVGIFILKKANKIKLDQSINNKDKDDN